MENKNFFGIMTIIFYSVGVSHFMQHKVGKGVLMILSILTPAIIVTPIIGVVKGIRVLCMDYNEYANVYGLQNVQSADSIDDIRCCIECGNPLAEINKGDRCEACRRKRNSVFKKVFLAIGGFLSTLFTLFLSILRIKKR